jgi:signal transduction histidine kinase
MPSPASTADRRAPQARRVSSTRLALAAISFVVFALLTLAIAPGFTNRALDTLRADADSTSGKAEQVLGELNLAMLQAIVEHQNVRLSSDAGALGRYRIARKAEDAKLTELVPLARLIGPATKEHAEALQSLMQRWSAVGDARAEGRIDDREFATLLPRVVAQRDSVFAELRELTDDVRDATARDQAARGLLVQRERGLSLTVGMLAILAVIALVWITRHDRMLTRELERALEEEARLRAEAEERRQDLERVTESKNRLMRGFTHDVKNPIGAADGFLQLLQDGILDPLTARQQHAVARSRSSLASALGLIHDLLEVARAGTDNLELSLARMDVVDIVNDLVEEYLPLAAQKGLSLFIDGNPPPTVVESDAARVRQVLGNLISNAVKYTQRGHIAIRVRTPTPRGNGSVASGAAVEVSDTGPGIPTEKRGLLFHEFVRLDPSAAPGAGVGLAISRRIAQALRGDVTVESIAGKGSTFILWLPGPVEAAVPETDLSYSHQSS